MSGERPFVDDKMFLGAHPLFSDVDDSCLDELTRLCQKRDCRADEVIVSQGQLGEEMFFIEKGRVCVSLDIGDGEPVVLGYLGTGEAFGELALFDRQERSATVTACERSSLCVIGREPFLHFLESHPKVAIVMLTHLSRRLRSASDVVREALYLDASTRLSDLLREMARAYGKHTRKGLLIDAPFSEQELGDITGLPREVVHAQLRHWREEGIISRHRGRITLLQPDQLVSSSQH